MNTHLTSFCAVNMELYVFVLILFIELHRCEPNKVQRNQVNNANVKQQTLSVPTSLFNTSNNGEAGRVEVLEAPDKRVNDKKAYRLIRLSNGLTALLISTQDNGLVGSRKRSKKAMEYLKFHQKKPACTLNVDVGSYSNPRDVQGLAHLVEHMVFKGSKKYPNEIEFYQFMRKTEGDTHARTDYEQTSFGFDTYEQFLDEALDRFSQFFKAPQMQKESLLREREAVESEFASVKIDDDARHARLLASLGEPMHPSRTFQCGNLKTLKENINDDELYHKTVEFRNRHYSAHRMHLALQSNQSLDNLQEMVMRHFSTIPNNNEPGDDFSAFTHLNAFQPKFYEKVYYVKPIKSGSKIVITWCLEPMMKKFEKNPAYILSFLLGNEGKGSLLSYLRKNLWATEMQAWDSKNGFKFNMGKNSLFSFFDISIRLTENGFDHLDDVLAAVFSYLKFLQRAKLDDSMFYGLRTSFANVNRFPYEVDAFDNVKLLTTNMLLYPSKFIITASDYLYNYDADAVKKTIDYLNSRRFNIMITLKRSKSQEVVYNSTEPWFGIKYMETDMPAKWIELHQKVKPYPEFTLPEANPFTADDFTILNTGGGVQSDPYLLFYAKMGDVWYRPNKKSALPYAEFYLYFQNTDAETSIDNHIQMTLLATLLNYQFVEELYPASLAGLSYRCSQSQSGILFKVTGFNQKMRLGLDIFGKTLKSLPNGPTEEEFNVFVQQQLEIYEKDILDPETMAGELRSSVLQSQYHPLWDRCKHLRSISVLDFQQFCRSFCEEASMRALVHGNIGEDYAVKVMENILNDFRCEKSENSTSKEIFESSVPNKLPIGAHYLRVNNFNPQDASSTITNFYQIGPDSGDTQLLLDLLEAIGLEPVYDILRNKEQLAYYVSFSLHNDLGIVGYSIIVNSQETKFTADYVDKRIENFRQELLSIIEQMSSNDFDTYKESLAKKKWTEYDESVGGYQWYWGTVRSKFNRVDGVVESLSNITTVQLLEFYRTNLDPANQRKLSIQVIGNAQADGSDTNSDDIDGSFDTLTYVNFTGDPKGNLIEDLVEFKNSLEEYPDDEEEYDEEVVSSSADARIVIHFKTVFYCSFLYIYFRTFY